jgi:hypothetical protein
LSDFSACLSNIVRAMAFLQVSGFRSSQFLAASSDANFGIEGQVRFWI